MTGCPTCGGYGDRHDPIAHGQVNDEPCMCGTDFTCLADEHDGLYIAEEECRCGHEHLRHDMGNGCIECRCRGFREVGR